MADERVVDFFVEIPRGSRSKYELDEKAGRLRLDRVLHSSVHYPADYGFIPETLAPDGDHLDALVIVEEPGLPGSLQSVRTVGLLDMVDEKGEDQKVLAVPVGDPRFDEVKALDDLPKHWRLEIETFFETYKALEGGKGATVKGWHDAAEAWRAIEKARRAYRSSRQRSPL